MAFAERIAFDGATDVAMNTKNELDQRVGERLRSRRLKMGVSQSELGAAAGVSFQQVQKYEKGANRISAGRMIQFAERLGVAPAYCRLTLRLTNFRHKHV